MRSIKYFLSVIFLAFCFIGCEKIEVEEAFRDNSSFVEIRMYNRQIVGDHASTIDVTISSVVNSTDHSVLVTVKPEADLKNLYGIAKLAAGCTVSPVSSSPSFGMVADFSSSQKYLVSSPNGSAQEWTVTVKK